jgi:hypothetical protein
MASLHASGNSSNLIAAVAKAKDMGLVTIGLSGGDGGKMKSSGVCDHILVRRTRSIASRNVMSPRTRTSEWRNQNPPNSPELSMLILKKHRNSPNSPVNGLALHSE